MCSFIFVFCLSVIYCFFFSSLAYCIAFECNDASNVHTPKNEKPQTHKIDDVIQTFSYGIHNEIFVYCSVAHKWSVIIFFSQWILFCSSASNDYNLMHKPSSVQSHTHVEKKEIMDFPWILITSRTSETLSFRLFCLIALVFQRYVRLRKLSIFIYDKCL